MNESQKKRVPESCTNYGCLGILQAYYKKVFDGLRSYIKENPPEGVYFMLNEDITPMAAEGIVEDYEIEVKNFIGKIREGFAAFKKIRNEQTREYVKNSVERHLERIKTTLKWAEEFAYGSS